MGRNKDSLIALAEKLTGETCGEVKTKKDALEKIACFYAGEEVECNTVADALQCIAEHCEGGASGGVDVESSLKGIELFYIASPKATGDKKSYEYKKDIYKYIFVHSIMGKEYLFEILPEWYEKETVLFSETVENTGSFTYDFIATPTTVGIKFVLRCSEFTGNNGAEQLQCALIPIIESGGGSESSSPITTLKAYAFSVAEQIVYAYSTEEITEKGTYILIYNDLMTGNRVVTEVTEDTFADENGNVFTRSKTHDVLIDAENELVEVELISGYDFNITSYNFKTQTDNNGIIQENQRFNYLSSYYDYTTECDLCVYGGSGKIGYYKIKQ